MPGRASEAAVCVPAAARGGAPWSSGRAIRQESGRIARSGCSRRPAAVAFSRFAPIVAAVSISSVDGRVGLRGVADATALPHWSNYGPAAEVRSAVMPWETVAQMPSHL